LDIQLGQKGTKGQVMGKKEIGRRIALRRKQIGLSQEEFANEIGSNQTQVSRYERGENDMTVEVFIKIADALDTTTDWLSGRTEIIDRPLRGAGDLDPMELEVIKELRELNHDDRQRLVKMIKAY
jgi:transcriptional regulator with XRE-family HTH domain